MAQHFWYYDPDDGIVEITDAVDERTIELRESAEEISVATSTLLIDDPDIARYVKPHHLFWVTEDEIASGEDAIYRGYTADRTFKRGRQPLGREMHTSLTDFNSLLAREVMRGTDCNRPAETDVQRMQWLINSAEASLVDDDTTYLSTASPVAMDKVDYRGQMMDAVLNDCLQASGKNAFVTYDFIDGDGTQLWYGHQSLTTFASPIRLSNDPAEQDYISTYPISADTTLERDPSRMYSGIYLPYGDRGGAVYRRSMASVNEIGRRDAIMSGVNVRTKAKAEARADRYLADLDEEADRITTTVLLPAQFVNEIRAGMRVQFRATHLPDYDGDFTWLRVLSRNVSYFAPGEYKLGLILDGPGTPLEPPEPPAGCGIDEGDAWSQTWSTGDGGVRNSYATGPTFTLQAGKSYRLAAEIDNLVRARPQAYTKLRAAVEWESGALAAWTPWPTQWINQPNPAQGPTYYSDWYAYSGGSQTGWVASSWDSVWSPGSTVTAHYWVECV